MWERKLCTLLPLRTVVEEPAGSLQSRGIPRVCVCISAITDITATETRLGGPVQQRAQIPAAVPEDSSGEHWWPSSRWSPTVILCQDPTQFTAYIGAASVMPKTLGWGQVCSQKRFSLHPQAEVGSAGTMTCSPCWKCGTLVSQMNLLPYPVHQGLCLPFVRDSDVAGDTAACTHIIPVYVLLVDAAAEGGRVYFCTLS